MKNRPWSVLLLLLSLLTLNQANGQDYNVNFDHNSDEIRAIDLDKLNQLVKEFQNSGGTILVVGHTDTTGNKAYNMNLSKRRANSIKTYLTKQGINESAIKLDFMGKMRPIKSDQYFNRRVEIFLENKKEVSIDSMEAFRNSLKPEKEIIIIPAGEEQEILGYQGTVIWIPAHAFVDSLGNLIKGNVIVELTEYQTFTEFYSDKLTTVSDSKVIISGGMVKLQVWQNGRELQLAKGVEIELSFEKNDRSDFIPFYGERKENGSMNWKPDGSYLKKDSKPNRSDDSLVYSLRGANYERKSDVILQTKKDNAKRLFKARMNALKVSRLGYINCDRFNTVPTKRVRLLANVKLANVKGLYAIVIFRNSNGFMDMEYIGNNRFELRGKMPLNENVEVLITGKSNGKVFSYYSTLTTKKKMVINAEMQETTYEEIQLILNL